MRKYIRNNAYKPQNCNKTLQSLLHQIVLTSWQYTLILKSSKQDSERLKSQKSILVDAKPSQWRKSIILSIIWCISRKRTRENRHDSEEKLRQVRMKIQLLFDKCDKLWKHGERGQKPLAVVEYNKEKSELIYVKK